jgi:uncharacterized DUF497 family protein
MADVWWLQQTDATEDELWKHGLSIDDAIDVLEAREFRTFRDPKNAKRRFMIGRNRQGRLLTFVIEPVNDKGDCRLITGWPSNQAETTLFFRQGGSRYAGQAPSPES